MRLTRIIVLLTLYNSAFSQPITDDVTPTSLYPYNYASLNPALIGAFGSRITGMGMLHVPKDYDPYSAVLVSGEYNIKKISSGVGVVTNVINNSYITSRFYQIMYNYQFKLNDRSKLILGIRGARREYVFDYSGFIYTQGGDPLLNPTKRKFNGWTSGLGVAYKHDKFFAGFSVGNIFQTTMTSKDDLQRFRSEPVYNLTAGADFEIEEKVILTTSLNGLFYLGTYTADLNTSGLLFDRWIAGVSLSASEAGIAPKVNGDKNG